MTKVRRVVFMEPSSSLPPARRDLRPAAGIVAIALTFITLQGVMLFAKVDMGLGFLAAEWLGLALPSVLFLRWVGVGAYRLHAVRPRGREMAVMLPLSIGLAGMGWSVVVAQIALWPPDPEYLQAFDQAIVEIVGDNRVWGVFLVAITPGVCEELFFRGVVLAVLLNSVTPRKAIVVSALVFAALHADPFRFFPQLVEGVVLGYVAWRTRSLYPAMLLHAGLNALALLLMLSFSGEMIAPEPPAHEQMAGLAGVIVGACVLAAAALYGVWKMTQDRAADTLSAPPPGA